MSALKPLSKSKRLSDYPVFLDNPFLRNIEIKKRRKAVALGEQKVVMDKEGEMTNEVARMVIKKPVDVGNFTKIYPDKIPFSLSGETIKVFLYILQKLRYNESRVYFNPKELMEEDRRAEGLYMSSATIYKAIKSLLGAEVIARTDDRCWWYFNPSVGFKGNRLMLGSD